MISEYFSHDGERNATIELDNDSYIITLYELDAPIKKMKDFQHSLPYWQDCCENWVNYWGEFSK